MRMLVVAIVLLFAGSWTPVAAAEHAPVHEVVHADLHDVRWYDGEMMRTGVTGSGPPVLHVEGFDSKGHDDLVDCRFDSYVALAGQSPSVENTELPIGTQGHGTWTAGSVCGQGNQFPHPGVAPGARILNWNSWLLAGDTDDAQWELQEAHDPQVFTHSTLQDPRHRWAPLDEGADIAVFWAAGNGGGHGHESQTVDTQGDPRYTVVAAATHDGTAVASYSSRGDRQDRSTWPDVTAPGCRYVAHPVTQPYEVVRRVVLPPEPAAGDCPEDEDEENAARQVSYYLVRGTSFAAPTVAGVAALVMEVHPEISTADLRYILFNTADPFLPANDLDEDGVVSPAEFYEEHGWQAGHGLVNATGAVAAAHHLARFGGDAEEAVACAWIQETADGRTLNPTNGCPAEETTEPQEPKPENNTKQKAAPHPVGTEPVRPAPALSPAIVLFLGILVASVRQRKQPASSDDLES